MSETIIKKDCGVQFKEDYTRYSIYIIFRRIFSDYRDGLKPIQRRILYAMYHDKKCSKSKSADIVGATMGNYHPHGDTAIYDSMKPMTNWFETYVPLINGGGNWGSFQGNPAAASRYTEAELSKFALECIFGDLDGTDNSIDWVESYKSPSIEEPEFLPVKVPLLLINGSFGIAVGEKTEVPTHNLSEVIDATITLMHNPNAEITLIPDHCQKCEIFDNDYRTICRLGYGHYTVRGIIKTETYKGKPALVITSVPNLTYLNSITDKIKELIANKKIIQIENTYDESQLDSLRYVIVLKNGADPEFVKNVIYKNTNMEQTLRINFETLDGLEPMRMSYSSYLLSFIEFRKMTKFRLYSNLLQKVQTKMHEKETYIKVLESGDIDNIIYMIRHTEKDDEYLIEYLINKLKITDLQAKYILTANINHLSIKYLEKFKEEAIECQRLQDQYMPMVMDDNAILAEIEQELLDIKRKYGHPRNCKVIHNNSATSDIPKGSMKIVLSEKNFIKKVPGNTSIGIFKNDTPKVITYTDNTDNILLFDDCGKVFKYPVHQIQFTDNVSNGTDVRFMIKGLTANINTIIPEMEIKQAAQYEAEAEQFLITLTKKGLIKKMCINDFMTVPKSGLIYCKLDEDDFIKDIAISDNTGMMIVYSNRKAIQVPIESVPYLKRNARGSKAMNSDVGIDGMCLINATSTDILVITSQGKINKLDRFVLSDLGHSKNGYNVVKLGASDSIYSIMAVNETNIIRVTTLHNTFDIPVNSIPFGSSISMGAKVFSTKGDMILRSEIIK